MLCLLLSLALLSLVESVTVKEFKTPTHKVDGPSMKELNGLRVECPNYGALKNFKITETNGEIGIVYNCYSPDAEKEEDEAVIKTRIYRTKSNIDCGPVCAKWTEIENWPIKCDVDYALNTWEIYFKDNKVEVYYICVDVKPEKETKIDQVTSLTNAGDVSYKYLVGTTCGSVEQESATNRGEALRGFHLKVDNYDPRKPKVGYEYGTITFKNVEKMKKEYLAKSMSFRENNTQKN